MDKVNDIAVWLQYTGVKILMDTKPSSYGVSRWLLPMKEQCDRIILVGCPSLVIEQETNQALKAEIEYLLERQREVAEREDKNQGFDTSIMPIFVELPKGMRVDSLFPLGLGNMVAVNFTDDDWFIDPKLFGRIAKQGNGPWQHELRFADSIIELVGTLYRYHKDSTLQQFVANARQQYCNQVSTILQMSKATDLLKVLGYSDRSRASNKILQTIQTHLEREEEMNKKHIAALDELIPPLLQPLRSAHETRLQQPELAQTINYYVPLDGQPLPSSPDSDRKVPS